MTELVLPDTAALVSSEVEAGWGPDHALRKLVERRGGAVEPLLEFLRGVDGTSFVVASAAGPPRIWEVAEGQVVDCTEVGHAWRGDSAAYEKFRRWYDGWPTATAELTLRTRPGSPLWTAEASPSSVWAVTAW